MIRLIASPAALRYGGAAAVNDRVTGPLTATLAAVAVSEVTRPVRRANVVTGAWLLAAPWVLGAPPAATWNALLVGAALVGRSFAGGRVTGHYGGGWSAVWRRPRPPPSAGGHQAG